MHEIGFLKDFVALLSLAILVVVLCHHVRLPAIVGFLLTGVLAGPTCLGVIDDKESVETLAEIGIVLLLFSVGVEFSLERLYRIRSVILIGGSLQVVLTGLATFVVADLLFSLEMPQAIFLGMLVALSSTAVVLKLLSQKGELDAPRGRIALGILIFQDLCIVPMMIVTPILAGEGGGVWSVTWTVTKALFMVVGAIVCGRYVIPWVLGQVVRTRNREAFLLITIILCLGTAWLSALAGLSLALGAFLAGLVVSQSEYSHQVLGEIVPFRDAFSSLFFISIGMLLDIQTFGNFGPLILGVLGLIVLKSVVSFAVSMVLGYNFRVSVLAGLVLAQIGEFSFVLAKPGLDLGVLDPELYQLFLAAAVMTMILTPFVIAAGPKIAELLAPFVPDWANRMRRREQPLEVAETLENHVVILGFGPTGRSLAHVLKGVEIPYVVIEMNPETVRKERKRGEPIFFGDAQRPEILEHARLSHARVLVVAINEPVSVRQVTHLARRTHPGLHIIVRTRFLSELKPLMEIGASEVIPEEFETSLEIFSRTLRHLLVPRDVVESILREARQDGYGFLRDEGSPREMEKINVALGAELEVFRVEEDSELEGKTLAESDLRRKTGASILAIQENGEFVVNPPVAARFEINQSVVLFGSPEQIVRAAQLFRAVEEKVV